jgi:tetratricopeptide (TPR) repeat protein
MAHELRCPSCGHQNTAEASTCSQCNFPLLEAAPAPAEPGRGASAPEAMPEIDIRRIRPIRPRRPADPQQQLQVQLVVVLGGLAVVIAILSVAWQGFQKNNTPAPAAVEGANPQQLADINLARNQLKSDSTNINAQIALANVLYDTANWPEAIIHYKSALRLDPTRVTTVVDMGVCYYNLSDVASAETLFTRALTMDPRQPIALYNLGIVAENRGELDKALKFYHGAMQSDPPPGMGDGLNAAIKRVMDRLGKKAPAAEGQGGGMPGGKPPGGTSPGGGF